MSIKTQKEAMKTLGNLLSRDLRKSGANGAKQEFLHKGTVFIRTLEKDLNFTESIVCVNKGRTAGSGEICLYGMWGKSSGLFIEMSQMPNIDACIMYRPISDIRGKKRGLNLFLSIAVLQTGDYDTLLRSFLVHQRLPFVLKKAA